QVDGEIARGQEVQRPAHRPDLDQGALAPERALELLQARALDSRPEREGSAGEELRVQPADPRGDTQLAAARRAPMQLVALEPQRPRLFPPELHALESTANRSADSPYSDHSAKSLARRVPSSSKGQKRRRARDRRLRA